MAKRSVSAKTLAAGILIQRLRRGKGRADTKQLQAALASHGLGPRYLSEGVRVIRDLYGADALIVKARSKSQSPLYVLDPQKYGEAREWAIKMFKRALTETRHVIHVLDWAQKNGLASASAKRAKHYARNVQVELDNVLSTL